GDGGGHGLELLALGDEVRLALQLDQDAGGVVVGDDRDHGAVLGGAALALGDALLALDAERLDGLVDVAVGLVQGLLAVHHAGAGELPELLDVGGGVVRHESVSLSRSLEVQRSAGRKTHSELWITMAAADLRVNGGSGCHVTAPAVITTDEAVRPARPRRPERPRQPEPRRASRPRRRGPRPASRP